MKYCPYCGADIIDGAVSFCVECGKQLPSVPQKQKKEKRIAGSQSQPFLIQKIRMSLT